MSETQLRKYFVSACDAGTGDPVVIGELEAIDFCGAVQATERLALEQTDGHPVRITGVTEQPDPQQTFNRLHTFRITRRTAMRPPE